MKRITTTQLQISEIYLFAKKSIRGETPNSGLKRPQAPGKTPTMQFQCKINDLKYLFQYDDFANHGRRVRDGADQWSEGQRLTNRELGPFNG